MALGTWKILNPVSNAYETLDLLSEHHQLILALDEFTLRDDGLAGAAAQETADLPFSGNYSIFAAAVDVATYSAGTAFPVFADPSNAAFAQPLASGAGSPFPVAAITTTNAARGTMLHGPIPTKTRFRVQGLTGDGTAKWLVRVTKWPVSA